MSHTGCTGLQLRELELAIDLLTFTQGAFGLRKDLLDPGTKTAALSVDKEELLLHADGELVLLGHATASYPRLTS